MRLRSMSPSGLFGSTGQIPIWHDTSSDSHWGNKTACASTVVDGTHAGWHWHCFKLQSDCMHCRTVAPSVARLCLCAGGPPGAPIILVIITSYIIHVEWDGDGACMPCHAMPCHAMPIYSSAVYYTACMHIIVWYDGSSKVPPTSRTPHWGLWGNQTRPSMSNSESLTK